MQIRVPGYLFRKTRTVRSRQLLPASLLWSTPIWRSSKRDQRWRPLARRERLYGRARAGRQHNGSEEQRLGGNGAEDEALPSGRKAGRPSQTDCQENSTPGRPPASVCLARGGHRTSSPLLIRRLFGSRALALSRVRPLSEGDGYHDPGARVDHVPY